MEVGFIFDLNMVYVDSTMEFPCMCYTVPIAATSMSSSLRFSPSLGKRQPASDCNMHYSLALAGIKDVTMCGRSDSSLPHDRRLCHLDWAKPNML